MKTNTAHTKSCPACRHPIHPRSWDSDLLEIHGIAPEREPRLGDRVYPRDDCRFFVVARARRSYSCKSCRNTISKGQRHASLRYSPSHYCLKCASFENGVARVEALLITSQGQMQQAA